MARCLLISGSKVRILAHPPKSRASSMVCGQPQDGWRKCHFLCSPDGRPGKPLSGFGFWEGCRHRAGQKRAYGPPAGCGGGWRGPARGLLATELTYEERRAGKKHPLWSPSCAATWMPWLQRSASSAPSWLPCGSSGVLPPAPKQASKLRLVHRDGLEQREPSADLRSRVPRPISQDEA